MGQDTWKDWLFPQVWAFDRFGAHAGKCLIFNVDGETLPAKWAMEYICTFLERWKVSKHFLEVLEARSSIPTVSTANPTIELLRHGGPPKLITHDEVIKHLQVAEESNLTAGQVKQCGRQNKENWNERIRGKYPNHTFEPI